MESKFTQKPDQCLHHSRASHSLPSTSSSSSSSKALFPTSDFRKKRNPFLLYSSQDNRGYSSTRRLILQPWIRFGAFSEKRRFLRLIGKLPKEGPQCSASSPNQFLIHVVKQGETLTSISRRYAVPLSAITAVNSNIIDVDLVFEGQHLNIPLSAGETQRDSVEGKLPKQMDAQYRSQSVLNILQVHETCNIFAKLPACHLQIAKATGYFLVLVPLVAFCIRCIAFAFHHRVAQELKPQAANESETPHHVSGSMRWKSILSDIGESDDAEAESSQNSVLLQICMFEANREQNPPLGHLNILNGRRRNDYSLPEKREGSCNGKSQVKRERSSSGVNLVDPCFILQKGILGIEV